MSDKTNLNVAANTTTEEKNERAKESSLLSPMLHRELPSGSFVKKKSLKATASRNVETATRCMATINKK